MKPAVAEPDRRRSIFYVQLAGAHRACAHVQPFGWVGPDSTRNTFVALQRLAGDLAAVLHRHRVMRRAELAVNLHSIVRAPDIAHRMRDERVVDREAVLVLLAE